MKSMMRGHERRRRRWITLVIVVIAMPIIAVGVWLLFFNDGSKLEVTYETSASEPAETPVPEVSPSESVLGISTAQTTPISTPESSVDKNDWRLLLVNSMHSLPEGFQVTLTELSNGHAVDSRCYPDLQQMMDDCRAEGLQPLICSSYRSQEKQQQLFDNKVNSLIEQGYSQDEANSKAATIIAVPGTSEHQTGLAVDIVDINNQNMDDSQENTPAQQWLMSNSWRYGFIFRFPADKTDITGIAFESWHYRYVGKEAASEIYERGICLEEYIEQLT
jgi:D-alanyl-D-alanine carboxypeptidase